MPGTTLAEVAWLPDEGWGYIGWADQYWLYDRSAKDYARGAAILSQAQPDIPCLPRSWAPLRGPAFAYKV